MKYGVSSRAGNEPLQRLTILSVTQFNVHLPWVKCEYASSRFQPGGGPSKGLFCDCKYSYFEKTRFQL